MRDFRRTLLRFFKNLPDEFVNAFILMVTSIQFRPLVRKISHLGYRFEINSPLLSRRQKKTRRSAEPSSFSVLLSIFAPGLIASAPAKSRSQILTDLPKSESRLYFRAFDLCAWRLFLCGHTRR